MKGKVRWFNVGNDTVQASSLKEAWKIVESIKAFEKKKGKAERDER